MFAPISFRHDVDNQRLTELIFIAAALYTFAGFVHWYFRKIIFLISTDPEEAYRRGISLKAWDLIF